MLIDGVTVKRTLHAPCERVFEAWTRPELMARWFFPKDGWTATVTADLKVGGRYELTMRDTEGGTHRQFGEYREIVVGSRLVFTWSCPELAVVDSVVTVVLVALGDRTEISITHELPPEPAIRRGHEEGWVGCLGSLDRMLNSEAKRT